MSRQPPEYPVINYIAVSSIDEQPSKIANGWVVKE
jgi:hypothetical protein